MDRKDNLTSSFVEEYQAELEYINSEKFNLGEYIYMGMANVKDKLICLSVAYKIDYALQKLLDATEEINATAGAVIVEPIKINKVKVGELEKEKSFYC